MMKETIKKVIPASCRRWIRNHVRMPLQMNRFLRYDGRRFLGYSGVRGATDNERLIARIIAQYHVVEKGLSFRDTRPFFGQAVVRNLMADLLVRAEMPVVEGRLQWESAVQVLRAYLKIHEDMEGVDPKEPILEQIRQFLQVHEAGIDNGRGGGTVECDRTTIQEAARGDFPQMALSRFSIRHFGSQPVDGEVIRQAVRWAQKSPSVCNRQSSRVHVVSSKECIGAVLALHGGTRGFSEQIDKLLIVTGDLRMFLGNTERNQVYLDAGIFVMSLLYGLHYLGVGACPLHWCVPPEKDVAMRRLVPIPEEETIATIVAIGSLPERFKVANSQRRPLGEVLFQG